MSDLPTTVDVPNAGSEVDPALPLPTSTPKPPTAPIDSTASAEATAGTQALDAPAIPTEQTEQTVNNPSAYVAPPTVAGSDPAAAATPDTNAQLAPPEPVDPAAEANKVGFDVRFLDFAGKPIVGLQHKVILTEDGKRLEFPAISDQQGRGPSMSGMQVSTPIEIWVRKDDGTYVIKHKGVVGCQDTSICLISPHIKIKLGTEVHAGAPGVTPPKPTAADPSVERLRNAPLTEASGGKMPDASLTSGRDARGNPVATATSPSVDSNGKHRLPTLGLFTWGARTDSDGSATTPQKTPSAVNGSHADPEKVAELIKAMEQQVTWDWSKVKSAYGGSAPIVAAMASKTFNYAQPTKDPAVFMGKCYLSVKVGLWRAGLVEGVGGGLHPATEAKAWLLPEGFVALTSADAPDARWALPGDVIVYQYDDATINANNDKYADALKKYDEEKKAFAVRQQAYVAEHDAWKARQKVSLSDLKAGKKPAKDPEPKPPVVPRPPEDENYGHIDVRSFDAYFSDAKWMSLQDPTLHGSHKGLVVNGIYRKTFDPVAGVRLRAFLKCLREWECHGEPDDAKRYFLLNLYSPIDGKYTFSDAAEHPYASVKAGSTAAGAYQILYPTYKLYRAPRFGLPAGFAPLLQDRMAVAMLEDVKDSPTKPTKSALGEIRKGNVREAVGMLAKQWSSLPGGVDARKEKGRVFTTDDFVARFDVFFKEYSNE